MKSYRLNYNFFTLGEGPTERELIKFYLNQNFFDKSFSIIPRLFDKNKNSIRQLLEKAKKTVNLTKNSRAFILSDFDKYCNDEGKRNSFKKAINKYAKLIGKEIFIFRTNPCIEYWLLLKFKEITKIFDNCDSLIDENLKKHIKNYKKARYDGKNKEYQRQLKIAFEHLDISINYAILRSLKSYPQQIIPINDFENFCNRSFSELFLLFGNFRKKQSLNYLIAFLQKIKKALSVKQLYYVYRKFDDEKVSLCFFDKQNLKNSLLKFESLSKQFFGENLGQNLMYKLDII